MSEARSWSNTPLHAADSEEDMAAVFASRAKGRSLVIGELMSGGLICYQRKKCVPHCPFQKNNQHLGSGASTYEGQSEDEDTGEIGTGRARDVQRTRE